MPKNALFLVKNRKNRLALGAPLFRKHKNGIKWYLLLFSFNGL